MEEQIFKLIYDYSVNGKVADEAFIDKIVELVVNTRELNSLVSGVSYSSDLEEREGSTEFSKRKVLATHSIDTGIISFNMENIYNNDKLKINFIDFNEFDVLITKNMEIAHIILHELEHVYQRKMFLSNNKDTIENKIINYDFAKREELINLINKYKNGEVSAEEAKPVIMDYSRKRY